MPKLSYSPWVPWEERNRIDSSKYPGIYLIAISTKDLSGLSPSYKDVVYIGITNSKQGLKGRWQQFFNSIRGKSGHSGGNTVYRHLGHYDNWPKKLFVSSMPIECNTETPDQTDLIKMGWVAFLEYEAFSEFYSEMPKNKKPKFNTK